MPQLVPPAGDAGHRHEPQSFRQFPAVAHLPGVRTGVQHLAGWRVFGKCQEATLQIVRALPGIVEQKVGVALISPCAVILPGLNPGQAPVAPGQIGASDARPLLQCRDRVPISPLTQGFYTQARFAISAADEDPLLGAGVSIPRRFFEQHLRPNYEG